jgi:hypothetical protein
MVGNSSIVGHVAIKNAGHLPAREVSPFIDMQWSRSGVEPDTFFPLGSGEGKIVLAPGSVATRGSRTTINIQDLIDAGGGHKPDRQSEAELFLYVWGSVRYNNGFNRTCTTKFCHRYNWITRDNLSQIDAIDARYHEYGNDAD